MGIPKRNLAAEIEERHTNKLPTPEARAAFVDRVAKAMEDGARALLETAKVLRANPEEMLTQAFVPNIIGMHPNVVAVVEISHLGDGSASNKPSIIIKGRTIIDGSRFSEIGFRAMWRENAIIPIRDDSVG